MTIITLTTDFGRGDYGVAMMRGVIWKIAPQAQLVDLCHEIRPQDVHQGAGLLTCCTPAFPAGAIHVAVVDPGVGTQRRPIAARLGEHFFVGPDNGLFSEIWQLSIQAGKSVEIVHLQEREYWLPRLTHIFHGRDIFAPIAAHLANGVQLQTLGTALERLILLD
jgi:hypothetical protein